MNNILQSLRSHPIRVVLAALIAIGLFFGYQQLTGYQKLIVDIKATDSGPVKIYRVKDDPKASPEALIEQKNPTKEVSKSSTEKLRKGHYVIVGGNSPDFRAEYSRVSLGKDPVTVVIDPPFSDEKLAAILQAEQPAIHAAIKQVVPGIDTKFLLGPGRLYEKGYWYGTVIYPNLTVEQRRLQYTDTYRVVVRKVNNQWQVVTLPPDMSLSSVVYPNIPHAVLSDTNSQRQP